MKNHLGGDGVDFGKYKETKYKPKTSKFTDKELKQMSKKVRDMLGGKELKFIESQKVRDIKHLILHGNY